MRFKRMWWLVAAGVIVVAVVVVGLVMYHKHQDTVSRHKATTAAATYQTQVHDYLAKLTETLGVISNNKANNDLEYTAAQQTTVEVKSAPQLAKVSGPGAQLAAYKQAQAFAAQVNKLTQDVSTAANAAHDSEKYLTAFTVLVDTENTSGAKLAGASDPAAALTSYVINPLTTAKTAFNSTPAVPGYQPMDDQLNAAFTSYISDATNLRGMYQSGNLHSVNYSLPDLSTLYNEIKTHTDSLNTTYDQLFARAQQLLAQKA